MTGPEPDRPAWPVWTTALLAALASFAVILALSFLVFDTVRTPIGKVSFAAGLGVLVFLGVYMNQRSRDR